MAILEFVVQEGIMQLIRVFLALALLGGAVSGQVVDGDFLIVARGSVTQRDFVIKVDRSTGICSTFLPPIIGWKPMWLRMSADNKYLVVSYFGLYNPSSISTALMSYYPGGSFSPKIIISDSVMEFQLDHDDRWIMPAADRGGSVLLAYEDTNNRITTLFNWPSTNRFLDILCTDRDPGFPPYVLVSNVLLPSFSSTIFRSDRHGILATIIQTPHLIYDTELEPATGDTIISSSYRTSGFHRMTKTGILTTVTTTVAGPGYIKFESDGTFWSICGQNNATVLAKLDGAGHVLGTIPIIGLPSGYSLYGLEIFGWRRLTCNGSGKPGTAVHVNLQSQRQGDGNRPYQLACSFARRPGMRLKNGERLDLCVNDPLFLASATNRLPGILQGFQGTTDASGYASARAEASPHIIPNVAVSAACSLKICE